MAIKSNPFLNKKLKQIKFQESKKNKNKNFRYFMIGNVMGLTVVVLAAGVFFSLNNRSGEQANSFSDQSKNSMSISASSKLPISYEVKTIDEISSSSINVDNQNANTANLAIGQYQKNKEKFGVSLVDPSSITKEEYQKLNGAAPTINASPTKAYKIELDYAAAGDTDMAKGVLTIKIDKPLKVRVNSFKDNFNGTELTVSSALFNEQNNSIIYGPGSSTASYSLVKLGQKGKFSLEIEVPANTNEGTYRITSLFKESDDNRPDVSPTSVFFVDVKK
jgi:hypothetical protein